MIFEAMLALVNCLVGLPALYMFLVSVIFKLTGSVICLRTSWICASMWPDFKVSSLVVSQVSIRFECPLTCVALEGCFTRVMAEMGIHVGGELRLVRAAFVGTQVYWHI